MLINEFEEMDGDILVCVLDALDKIHVSCLKENNLPAFKMNELINNFRKDIYELLIKKYKLPIFRLNSSE